MVPANTGHVPLPPAECDLPLGPVPPAHFISTRPLVRRHACRHHGMGRDGVACISGRVSPLYPRRGPSHAANRNSARSPGLGRPKTKRPSLVPGGQVAFCVFGPSVHPTTQTKKKSLLRTNRTSRADGFAAGSTYEYGVRLVLCVPELR